MEEFELILNGETFRFPLSGNQDYPELIAAWARAITAAVEAGPSGDTGGISVAADIANDQSSFTDVPGVRFHGSNITSIHVHYHVQRESTTESKYESGIMVVNAPDGYSTTCGGITGNSGVTFGVTASGQLQYKSDDIGVGGYSGSMELSIDIL